MTPKSEILKVLGRHVSGTYDDLHRANAMFGKMSEETLDKQYGQSGQTCREVFDQYKRNHAKAVALNLWAEDNIPDGGEM